VQRSKRTRQQSSATARSWPNSVSRRQIPRRLRSPRACSHAEHYKRSEQCSRRWNIPIRPEERLKPSGRVCDMNEWMHRFERQCGKRARYTNEQRESEGQLATVRHKRHDSTSRSEHDKVDSDTRKNNASHVGGREKLLKQ
jgi:hypothetical protein